MALDISTLMEEGACLGCSVGASQSQQLALALYRRSLLILDPNADVTPEGLMEYGKCFCDAGGSMANRMELALLGKIADVA